MSETNPRRTGPEAFNDACGRGVRKLLLGTQELDELRTMYGGLIPSVTPFRLRGVKIIEVAVYNYIEEIP